MRFLLKEKCCCGVDLRLGGLIVACLSLGFCSLDLFYAIGKGASFIDFIAEGMFVYIFLYYRMHREYILLYPFLSSKLLSCFNCGDHRMHLWNS